jgi:hypothetical protein
MADKAQWWQKIGTVAQIVSAAAAFFGLLAISLQVDTIRKNARQASARQIYLAYMDIASRNPQFDEPDYAAIQTQRDSRVKYKWFVLYLLWACDEILDVLYEDPWINGCKYDMKKHYAFLCRDFYADEMEQYHPKMQKFIRRAITDAPKEKFPECSNPKYHQRKPT